MCYRYENERYNIFELLLVAICILLRLLRSGSRLNPDRNVDINHIYFTSIEKQVLKKTYTLSIPLPKTKTVLAPNVLAQ